MQLTSYGKCESLGEHLEWKDLDNYRIDQLSSNDILSSGSWLITSRYSGFLDSVISHLHLPVLEKIRRQSRRSCPRLVGEEWWRCLGCYDWEIKNAETAGRRAGWKQIPLAVRTQKYSRIVPADDAIISRVIALYDSPKTSSTVLLFLFMIHD